MAENDACSSVSGGNSLERRYPIDRWPEAFARQLTALLQKYNVCESELIARAGLNPRFFQMARCGIRRPYRDRLIRIAFALACDVTETQALITSVGHACLWEHYKRDAVILYCLNRRTGLALCQQMLEKLELQPLGA